MKYAQVIDDTIVNAIEWDGRSKFPHAGALILFPEGADIGFKRAGKQWVDPNPPPPPPPQPDVVAPTIEERLAALEAKVDADLK